MRIFNHVEECPADHAGAVVVLGNFDGVHRGHQEVLATGMRLARDKGVGLTVLSFEPHPRAYFRPDDPPFRLTPSVGKARLLARLGVDTLFSLRFDRDLAGLTAQRFIDEVLVSGLGCGAVVVGHDFKFGQGRGGDAALLADDRRFETRIVAAQRTADGSICSSTRIRGFLRDGCPDLAATLLGRNFEIEGQVITGDRRGRSIGFPTANLELADYLRPAYGVYALKVAVVGSPAEHTGRGMGDDDATLWRDGVANLGIRPTVDGSRELFEIHLFDFDGDLYGRHLRAALVGFIRGERKFAGLAALKAQIATDCTAARRLLQDQKQNQAEAE